MQDTQPQPQTPATQPQQQTLQTVSKQELINLARSKTKQSKALAVKNSRLQSRYVQVFKQVKLLRKDHNTFLQTLQMIFESRQQKPAGTWEIDEIKQKWEKRQKHAAQKLEDIKLKHKEEQERNKQKIKEEVMKNYKLEETKANEKMQNLQNQMKQIKVYNEKLIKQISVLHQTLHKQKQQLKVQTDKKVEFQMQLNRIKVNEAKQELEKTLSSFGDKKEDVQARTEILLMRQEIDSLHLKNDELNDVITKLETKLRTKNKEVQILKEKNESYSKVQKYPPPTSNISPSISTTVPQIINIPLEKNPSQKEKQPKQKQTQPLQKEYFKNIFIRFVKCLNQSNYLQAQTLQNVLMTLLEFNNREREQAAIRQKTWWSIFQ